MAKQSYAEKLKDPRWQKKRLEIMQRDDWHCCICGDNRTQLHVHHKRYLPGLMPWEYSCDDLMTLCDHCHVTYETIKGFEFVKDVPIDSIKGYKVYHTTGDITVFYSIGNVISASFFNDKGIPVGGRSFEGKHSEGIISICQNMPIIQEATPETIEA